MRAHLLKAAAVIFLLAMAAHSAAIVYYNRSFSSPNIGAAATLPDDRREMQVTAITAGGPAERAGLRAGDRIIRVNGEPLTTVYPFWDAIDRGTPGDSVSLEVRRADDPATHHVTIALAPPVVPPELGPLTFARIAALNVLSFYPIPFLIIVAVVLSQRYHDRHAWMLAALFAGFTTGARTLELEPIIHPALRTPLIAYSLIWWLVPPGAFYFFFATFPEPTPLDHRAPWLKAVLFGVPLAAGVGLALITLLSVETPVYVRPGGLHGPAQGWLVLAISVLSLAGYGLGLVSLAWNAFRGQPETRRRTRVMLWGTVAAILPILVVGVIASVYDIEFIALPFWVWVGALMALFLLPISFAYAVVKHRVMEIPVLLRRSARYVVVRHAIVTVAIVIGLALTLAFASIFSQALPGEAGEGTSEIERRVLSGIAGALFGVLIVVATRQGLSRITRRVDRAFFREEYDARQLLQDLARQTRTATDRQQLAELLERSLTAALHPKTIRVLLGTSADAIEIEQLLTTRGGAIVLKPGELPPSLESLADVEPELLAPMQGYDERVEGLIVLGSRRSDEPYGREDRELVASVAAQAGIALQNLRLANVIAERMEAERRAARELDIAREVQAKLLPQYVPPFASLDYAGICIQAREVGGDYYDLLQLGPGRLGLVLADISGKGISAALLMASLQASLRSHYAAAPDDLSRILHAVNRAFFASTETNRYATLFFGIYDEGSARLHYANCGHQPPVLMRPDGTIDRLSPTAGVVGLFEEWDCEIREVDFVRGDTLVIFSDGVVEAFDPHDEEFGEERLFALLREGLALSADQVVRSVVDAVQRHSGPESSDDCTLIVARGLSAPSQREAGAAMTTTPMRSVFLSPLGAGNTSSA